MSVAQSMKRSARLNPPEYVIGLGDNFYFHGVQNENDKMFEETFEKGTWLKNSVFPEYRNTFWLECSNDSHEKSTIRVNYSVLGTFALGITIGLLDSI